MDTDRKEAKKAQAKTASPEALEQVRIEDLAVFKIEKINKKGTVF
jgi:hypothetical protein